MKNELLQIFRDAALGFCGLTLFVGLLFILALFAQGMLWVSDFLLYLFGAK